MSSYDKARLPSPMRSALPMYALGAYMEAYSSAWEQYQDPAQRHDGLTPEEAAHRVAWAAVQQKYQTVQASNKWRRPKRH